MSNDTRAEIAYIMKGFPRFSETFIANEIHLLEQMGLVLRLFSVKRGDATKRHDVVSRILAPVNYVPEVTSVSQCSLLFWLYHNAPKFVGSHYRVFVKRPRAYWSTLLKAVGMSWRYRLGRLGTPRKVFIKEFVQAGFIADQILAFPNIRHLHGHFCHGATTVTWFVSQFTEVPFSFTAHAKDIYQHKLNPGDLLQRKMAAATFVATCTGANHQHLTNLVPHSKTVHTIYHGLDTGFFSPQYKKQDSSSTPLIVAVGRFVEKKGFPYLVDACAQLKRLGLQFRCRIVGEKDEQFEVIWRMIQTLGLQDRVFLHDAVSQEELRDMYREATIFALPCQIMSDGDRDGIPNVLVEAMAMGLPIVSTRISGIPELVQDGVEGILVPQRDSDALAQALQRLLQNPELGRTMGVAARAKICRCFDSRKTTGVLRDLFQRTLSGMEAMA